MEMLLTVEQAAARLQLAPYTVRAQLKRGVLHGIKRGRVWRIPESALTAGPISPLESALAMVESRDAQRGPVAMREAGVNDAAAELRAMREEATP